MKKILILFFFLFITSCSEDPFDSVNSKCLNLCKEEYPETIHGIWNGEDLFLDVTRCVCILKNNIEKIIFFQRK